MGVVLVASGVVHLAVWAVLGGPWEGPVTWRKPSFSDLGGLTAVSLGWAWSQLARRRGDEWLAAAHSLVARDRGGTHRPAARWRGVASHFNRQTRLDSWLYDLMGGLILFVTAVIIDLTIRWCRGRPAVAADMLLAGRSGLVLLAVSCLLGIWASVHGDMQVAAGRREVFGAAGVVKFPHGVVIHAIQWLPCIAWAARRAGFGQRVAHAARGRGRGRLGALARLRALADARRSPAIWRRDREPRRGMPPIRDRQQASLYRAWRSGRASSPGPPGR